MGKLFKTNEKLKNSRELVEAYPYVQKTYMIIVLVYSFIVVFINSSIVLLVTKW